MFSQGQPGPRLLPIILENSTIWVVVCTGVVLSVVTYWIIQHQLDLNRRLDFEWAGKNRFRALQKETEKNLEKVEIVRNLLTGQEAISEEIFRRTARIILQGYPEIQLLAWIPKVPAARRRPFEGRVRRTFPDFRIGSPSANAGTPPANHFPILHLEPETGYQALRGLDMAVLPKRMTILNRAWNSGRLTASGRITGLEENDGERTRFSVFLPLYYPGSDMSTVAARRKNLRGFLAAVFRIDSLVNAALGHLEPRGIDIWIHDDAAPDRDGLLYHYASRLGHLKTRRPHSPPTIDEAPRVVEHLPVADRTWTFTALATPRFRSAQAFVEGPMVVLVEGLLFTLVLGLHLYRIKRDMIVRAEMESAVQESAERFQILFRHVPDVIMMLDRDSRILYMNRPLPNRRDEAEGHSFMEFLPASEREPHRAALKEVFETGEVHHAHHSLPGFTWWESRLIPIHHEGTVHSAMAILTDVTENRELQAQAIRSARLATLGVLAASVAHEINNPNSAIQFNASVLQRFSIDLATIIDRQRRQEGDFSIGGMPAAEALESLPKLFSGIIHNSDRIKKIVNTLKRMSRQDAGTLDQRVDVSETLKGAVSILQNKIKKNCDHFQMTLANDLPSVKGNMQQLEQVFINVILNALQALPDRRHGIRVTADRDQNGEAVVIRVRDEGRGISPARIQHVTDPFFTTREESGGTGLGLSISSQIIQNHGGSMHFQSQLGKGTLVTIKLPLIPSALNGLKT